MKRPQKGGLIIHFLKNENGWVTAFFAVMLPVFLLFAALGLDYGRAYVLKHQLQAACDAASLAGASAVSIKLITDEFGNVIEGAEKLVIDPVVADARAADIWNQNVASLKFSEKGVTIVDASNHEAFDSDADGYIDSYKWGVTAKIKTLLAGQITGTAEEITVTREAVSKVRNK